MSPFDGIEHTSFPTHSLHILPIIIIHNYDEDDDDYNEHDYDDADDYDDDDDYKDNDYKGRHQNKKHTSIRALPECGGVYPCPNFFDTFLYYVKVP